MRADVEIIEAIEDEDDSAHRFRRPWRVAVKASAAAIAAYSAGAVGYLIRFRHDLTETTFTAVALIPFGIVVCCIAYAWLGAWLGRRFADWIIGGALIAAFVGGLIALRRYLDLD